METATKHEPVSCYHATLASALGLYGTGALVAALCVVIGVRAPASRGFLGAGVAVIAWLIAVRIRSRVRVSSEGLESRTLFGGGRLQWSEIRRVRHAAAGGYWSSRVHGPSVLEFSSPRRRLRVNFKLFARECLQDVLSHLPPEAKDDG